MWKFGCYLFVLLALSLGAVHGKPPEQKTITKAEAAQAIAIFRRDPLGPQGQMARTLIIRFAENSPDAEVIISPKLLPWVSDKQLTTNEGASLITAYMAGTISSQLNGGDAHSTALVAACEQAIATYRQMQKQRPDLRAPGVEKLIALQKKGTLVKYLQEAERDR